MESRHQKRLDACWNALKSSFGDDVAQWPSKKHISEFYGGLRKTSGDIHTAGLAMALAFRAGKGDAGQLVYRALSRSCAESLGIPDYANTELLPLLQDRDTAFLILATEECAACCGVMSYYLDGGGIKAEEVSDEDAAMLTAGVPA